MLPSSPDIAEHVTAHAGHGASAWVAGVLATAASIVLPPEVMDYALRLVLALPVGVLTGLGTSFATFLIRRARGKRSIPPPSR